MKLKYIFLILRIFQILNQRPSIIIFHQSNKSKITQRILKPEKLKIVSTVKNPPISSRTERGKERWERQLAAMVKVAVGQPCRGCGSWTKRKRENNPPSTIEGDKNDKRKVGIARMFRLSVPLATHFRPEFSNRSRSRSSVFPTDGHEMEAYVPRSKPLPPLPLIFFRDIPRTRKENLSAGFE